MTEKLMPAPDRIWLEPDCAVEERCWCEHDNGPCDECGLPWVEYVRADTRSTPPVSEEMVERVARALCEEDGYDPGALEPGDDPYQCRPGLPSPCIDGQNGKGEPCHFFWRHYDLLARAALSAIHRSPNHDA